jgi:hypothetical protein
MKLDTVMAKAGWPVVVSTTLLLGWIDLETGHDLNFFVFYFLPVGLAAWYRSAGASVIVSLLSAAVWCAADAFSGHNYPSGIFAVWNTGIRLSSFLMIGWSLSRIRQLLLAESESAASLRDALAKVQQLEGLLPICMYCKRIRDEKQDWHQLESYISDRSEAKFSHSMCPECAQKHFPDIFPNKPEG